MDKDAVILQEFYYIYFRSPTHEEFEACGGSDIGKGKYADTVKAYGYPKPTKAETYEVINLRNGDVLFTGTSRDIAEEYDIPNPFRVADVAKRNVRFRCEYRFRHKPFDAKLVKKEIEKYEGNLG